MLKRYFFLIMVLIFSREIYAKDSAENPSWLYTVHSDYAILKKENAKMQIVFPESAKVIGFTDRPFRNIKVLDLKKLASTWNKGTNSFAKNPPNAALIINDSTAIIELSSMKFENKKAVFSYTILEQDTSKLKINIPYKTYMVIDSWQSVRKNRVCDDDDDNSDS